MEPKITKFFKKFRRKKEVDLPEGFRLKMPDHSNKPTGITRLPEGLVVGGYLDLSDCTGITSLPEGLTVGGDLDVTKIDINKEVSALDK